MIHNAPPLGRLSEKIGRGARLAGVLTLLLATSAFANGPEAVVEDFFGAYRAADVDKMTAIYAEDVRFFDVSQRHEVNGREAMRENLARLAAIHKQMDVEIKRRAVTGGLVTVEIVYSGTLDCAALGRPDREDLAYSLPAVLLFDVADGKIQSQTDYLDFRTFTETFAAIQAPVSTDTK